MTASPMALPVCDIEPLGDNQKLLRVTLQGRVSKALAGAIVQESFSSFCKRT